MKEIIIKSIKIGVIGFLVSSLFPFISWGILLFDSDLPLSLESIYIIHNKNILTWIIDLAPFVIGGLSFYSGKLVVTHSKNLNDKIEEQNKTHENFVLFADNIKNNNFEYQYEIKGKEDKLGIALVQMRLDLIESSKKDRDKNWLGVGIGKISTILRINQDIEELTQDLITEIVNYTNTVQGAIFLTKNDDSKLPIKERAKKTTLEMYGHYAYGRKKYTKSSYRLGEGLIGEAAIDNYTIHRTDIPDDYLTITSGLIEDEKPKALLIVPLVSEDQLQGVIEISSFLKFTKVQIQFIEEAASIIARSLYNIKINNTTSQLLIESQEMTRDLKEQQETLEHNSVEMQANQEEIENTNLKLEAQLIEINNAQKRQNALLKNSSEVITIYDENGTVTYESPSITKILGYSPEDMLETNIFESNDPTTSVIKLRELFSFVKENPQQNKTNEIPYLKKNGEEVILEALAINLITDKAVKGIVINFRDITQRLLAEKEQAIRAKMQALSENSKDIIVRFNLKKQFQYANPSLYNYTGLKPSFVKDKCIDEVDLAPDFAKSVTEIIDKVNKDKLLETTEVTFNSLEGLKIILINAIPEFDEEQNLESVLLVGHDITERKHQENILAKINKQIKDSINYARRIQDAIIPNLTDIKKDLGEVIQYYNPKDVVSGDFPYYYKKGKYVYYAAIDCTGHGVPGAMMSLIGHLLLNEILNNDEIYTPAEVLTKLHWGIVKTLKQDRPENTAADGMDVAMCRVDIENNDLLYSGAHRPLYHVVGDEIIQYKGDKYPIGGNQYKGLNNFSDHDIKLNKGESIYFFSDGYPDQFGGPDGLKYGPKRIREGILKNKDKSVEEITEYFSSNFEEWKSGEKQIDDVLLIGVKF